MANFAVLGRTDDQVRAGASAAGLALRVDELRRIAGALGRDPTIVEAHAFDAQWSEHCSYKSSRHHLRELPTDGPTVMQGPAEDAGILHLGEHAGARYGVVIAHESHNHPSQVVPFEGAATGIGGIVRDVLCMGAEVIAVADPLRFGRVEDPDSHQRYVARGVVDGIAAYGNAIGVPNIAGDVYFDERFDENCLVNVVALGLLREDEIVHSAAPERSEGWDIVLVGKATDASGFGGAAFSSVTLDEADAEANKGAVQVPDPFLKNVIMRATYRVFAYLRENRIRAGFKDLGAGGIMGCSAEICASGGYGAIVDLDDVNTAFDGMPPEVIAIGETQERLLWVLPPDVTAHVLAIYNETFSLPEIARFARAGVIGAVSGDRRYVLRHGGETVMDVPIDLLTGSIRDELPVKPAVSPPAATAYVSMRFDLASALRFVLTHRDVCSRKPLFRRYDGVVRGTTVIPRGAADAGVIAPVDGAPFGVALAVAGNPRYGAIHASRAAELAVAEAVRAVVAVGARPLGLTDCLNFGNPQNLEHYSQLVHAIGGLALAARELGTPYVSGNVSLYNESKSGKAIPASPIVACVGAVDDLRHVITGGAKRAGSAIYRIGAVEPGIAGAVIAEFLGAADELPAVSYESACKQQAVILEAARAGVLGAVRSIRDGGMLAALCRMLFAAHQPIGARIGDPCSWLGAGVNHIQAFFGEGGGFVAEVTDEAAFNRIALGRRCAAVKIGETTEEPVLRIDDEAGDGATVSLEELYALWSVPLAEVYA